jgi:hypothetical protein
MGRISAPAGRGETRPPNNDLFGPKFGSPSMRGNFPLPCANLLKPEQLRENLRRVAEGSTLPGVECHPSSRRRRRRRALTLEVASQRTRENRPLAGSNRAGCGTWRASEHAVCTMGTNDQRPQHDPSC